MKQLFLLFLTLFLFTNITTSSATHVSGGEFTYTHVSGNDYLVSLYLYRDCSGVGVPTTITININSVASGISFSPTLSQLGSPTIVTALPSGQTTCNGGSVQGYIKYTYQSTVTFPGTAVDWKMSFRICCRNGAITNIITPTSQNAYIESTLNNTLQNNSPIYHVEPVFYGSMGSNFSVALGGYDPDGDNLLFFIDNPLDNQTTPIPFVTGLSTVQPLDIDAGTTVSFSNTTGQFDCVLSTANQVVVFDIIVEEYRSGQLIASHRRTIQLLPLNLGGHSPQKPSMTAGANGSILDQYTMEYNVPGQDFGFSLVYTDNDAADVLTYQAAYSSIMAIFPNAQITSSYPLGTANQLQLDITIPNPQPALFSIMVVENGFLQHTSTYQLKDANATSLQPISEVKNNVRVYPNPLDKQAIFEVTDGNYNELNLQIFDALGRSIHTQTVQEQQQIQFHRKDISAGIYSYQLHGDGQLIKVDLLKIN